MGLDPVTLGYAAFAMAAAGTAVSVYSSVEQGKQQENIAEQNAVSVAREGAREQDAALAQAAKIRKAARAQAGEANAAMAASGVAIGEGSAVRINEDIYKHAEEDAFSVMLTGSRRQRSADEQSAIISQQGINARTAGNLNAASSLLASGGKIASGWKASSSSYNYANDESGSRYSATGADVMARR